MKPQAISAALEASKRRFQDSLAVQALRRAVVSLRASKPIEERDREFILMKLEIAHDEELRRVKGLAPSVFKAYMVDFIQGDLGITIEQAAQFVASDGVTVAAIKQQLKKIRRANTPYRILDRARKRQRRLQRGRK